MMTNYLGVDGGGVRVVRSRDLLDELGWETLTKTKDCNS